MSKAQPLLDRLEKVKPVGRGKWKARCPAHPDRTPSLSVGELPDGRILIHCHAECEPGDVLASVGMSLSDLYPDGPLGDFGPLWWAKKDREKKENAQVDAELYRVVLRMYDDKRAAGEKLTPEELRKERDAWMRVTGRA